MDAAADDPREVARLQALAFGRDVPEEARAEALERLAKASPGMVHEDDVRDDPKPADVPSRRRLTRRGALVIVGVLALATTAGAWLISAISHASSR